MHILKNMKIYYLILFGFLFLAFIHGERQPGSHEITVDVYTDTGNVRGRSIGHCQLKYEDDTGEEFLPTGIESVASVDGDGSNADKSSGRSHSTLLTSHICNTLILAARTGAKGVCGGDIFQSSKHAN
jgi:hypothetical protein